MDASVGSNAIHVTAAKSALVKLMIFSYWFSEITVAAQTSGELAKVVAPVDRMIPANNKPVNFFIFICIPSF